MGLTTFRLVAPYILLLLAVVGAGGECSLSHATIRISSAVVVPRNICALIHNGLMFLATSSRSAVIDDLDLYQQVNGCHALPRMRVQEILEVIDRCIEGVPYLPLDDAYAQTKALSNMVAFLGTYAEYLPQS